MRRLICRLFGHARSRRHARRTVSGWRSRCRRCNTPLVRVSKGVWQPEEVAREVG